MIRRIFVDLESTGDGMNPYHDILEISCKYYENHKLVAEFNDRYSPSDTTVYQYKEFIPKGELHKSKNYKDSIDGAMDFKK